ncbi:MAG TPA: ComEC/Rec2 family competence protein, partial [Spirochaetota bacterium]|nr:ComEC/Rec2 family competence protein [Spirochaetota bacterium]
SIFSAIFLIFFLKRYFLLLLIPFAIIILSLFMIRLNSIEKFYNEANSSIIISEKFIGYINSYPIYKNGKLSFKFKVIGIKNSEVIDYLKVKNFNILVKIKTEDRKIVKYGDLLAIEKKISFAQEKIFDFYYRRFLYYQNVYGICYIKENDFRVIKNIKADWWTELIKNTVYNLREYIIDGITINLNYKSSSFILSIFLGLRNEMDEETLNDFRDTGLLHLIAISGLHIGFIGSIFFSLFNFFLSKSKSYIFSIIFLFIYILLLIPQASSQRAFIMYCIMALFFIAGNKTSGITILSFSCILLMFLNPYSIFDIGFQLSFLATLGILLFSKSIEEKLPIFLPDKLKSIISVTVSAFLSILLLQWSLFRKIAFFSLISSIIMVPLFEILFISLFFLVFSMFTLKIKFISFIINILCGIYLKLVEILDLIPPVTMIKIPVFISYFSIPILFCIFYIFIPFIIKNIKNIKLLH